MINAVEIFVILYLENITHINLQVVVTPNTLRVQIGKTYELTCIVHGALADTHVYWIQEKPERVKLLDVILTYCIYQSVVLSLRDFSDICLLL